MRALSGSLLLLPQPFLSRLDSDNARVLDVGTGNAIWLSAFHDSISSTAQLFGIDIERGMYPSKHPPQMSFESCSVLDLPSNCFFAMSDLDLNQADHLPTLIRAAGFSDVLVHDMEWRLHGESNQLSRENSLRGHKGLKVPLVNCGLVSSDLVFDNMMAGVEDEWEGTPGTPLIIRVITGRKP
ncbi:MAG: hypothetical protein Q9169_004372 [Polycauliona sp. 2 TL-2023]